jgi:uncharacterized membrane protein (DUF485 family)
MRNEPGAAHTESGEVEAAEVALTAQAASREREARASAMATVGLILGVGGPALAFWIAANSPAWCSTPFVGCLFEALLLGVGGLLLGFVLTVVAYLRARRLWMLLPLGINTLFMAVLATAVMSFLS